MIELLTFDESGNLVINRQEVLLITQFAVLFKRRKGMTGDSEGREKKLNTLEMAYVKYMADALLDNNLYAAFEKPERSKKIIADIGFPADWQPDEAVEAAIEKYIEIQETYAPSAALLNSMQRGLKTSSRSVDAFASQMNVVLKQVEKKVEDIMTSDAGLDDAAVAAINTLNSVAFNNMDRLIALSSTLPKALESIEKLSVQVKKETGKSKDLKGGQEKGRREDPT